MTTIFWTSVVPFLTTSMCNLAFFLPLRSLRATAMVVVSRQSSRRGICVNGRYSEDGAARVLDHGSKRQARARAHRQLTEPVLLIQYFFGARYFIIIPFIIIIQFDHVPASSSSSSSLWVLVLSSIQSPEYTPFWTTNVDMSIRYK